MAAESWLKIDSQSPFSLENIPFGIASKPSEPAAPTPAVAVGDHVIFLQELAAGGALAQCPEIQPHLAVFACDTLNDFAALGRRLHRAFRLYLRSLLLLRTSSPALLKDNTLLRSNAIYPRTECRLHLPMHIGDYTDFYAGQNHAYNVGVLFRGAQNALQPNYQHLPVGYHGRASTVRISGHPVRRPWGQTLPQPGAARPVCRPCQKLDVELELAAFVCKGNGAGGEPIPVKQASEYIFGYVLMNDWSARDIQAWEYVPLGPFNSKNFCTTISPWVVLADALEPFRCASTIPAPSTPLLPYLSESSSVAGKYPGTHYDIRLTVALRPAVPGAATSSTSELIPICHTNSTHLLYSFPQMLAHHTIAGCEMHVGDLLGSGTISGSAPGSMGSLLEMTMNGKQPLVLGDADSSHGTITRYFLQDGDEVNITGVAGVKGSFVGFGDCRGMILPALDLTMENS